MTNITAPEVQNFPLSPFVTISHDWFSLIVDDNGRSDHLGITLMAILFNFFRNPPVDPDFYNGPELPYLEEDKLVVNYEYISNKFGCSNETIRRCFVRLEKLGLLKRETVNVQLNNGQRVNKIYINFSSKFLDSSVRDPETDLRAVPIKKKTPLNLESSTQDSQICGHLIKDAENNYNNRSIGSNFEFKDFGINELSSNYHLQNKQQRKIPKKINTLKDFYPLSDKDTEELQILSGREFSKGAMNEILLSMANKLPGREFFSRKGFLSYMSKAFSYEKRQALVINNENFRIKSNYSDEELKIREREQFLSSLEYNLETSPEMHFKKKLAAVLSPEVAYNLLKSHISTKVEGKELILKLNKPTEINKASIALILNQANAVYSKIGQGQIKQITNIKVEVRNQNLLNNEACNSDSKERINLLNVCKIPDGVWGNVRKKLISEFGDQGRAIDKSWFSKLSEEVDEKQKTLSLKAPSEFFKDYITSNYLQKIKRYAQSLGYEVGDVLLC